MDLHMETKATMHLNQKIKFSIHHWIKQQEIRKILSRSKLQYKFSNYQINKIHFSKLLNFKIKQ